MKIFITAALLLVCAFGLANERPHFALFGLVGVAVMYGLVVIRDSYQRSKNRFTKMHTIPFFLFFGATTHAQVIVTSHTGINAAPKFERRYSYMESRDKGDPTTYSFTINCLIVSNGELLKIVVGDEADLLPIVGYGKDADGFDFIDTEEYRIVVRTNDVIRIWTYTMKIYDRFAYPKN